MLLTEDNPARATFSGRATQAPPWWKQSRKKDHSPEFALLMEFRDFWAYFEPIRENMPKNCSADVQAVISYVDEVFTGTNETAIEGVKDAFGLGAITHLDDAAGARKPSNASVSDAVLTRIPSAQQLLGLAKPADHLWAEWFVPSFMHRTRADSIV